MVAVKVGAFEHTIKYAQSIKLNIPFVHLSTTFPDDLWSTGASNEELIQRMFKEIKICEQYKIPIAVMHVFTGDFINKLVVPFKNGLKSMKKIVEFAKAHNVKIAIENLDNINNNRLTHLLKHIKDDNFGFCYDAGHHNLYLPKLNFLKKYKNRIFAIHLHDNLMDWTYGFDWTRDLHRLPFDGKIDFEKACKQLAKLNYTGSIMLELHKTYYNNKYPNIYDNLNNLDFLKEARKSGSLLAEKIEKFKAE